MLSISLPCLHKCLLVLQVAISLQVLGQGIVGNISVEAAQQFFDLLQEHLPGFTGRAWQGSVRFNFGISTADQGTQAEILHKLLCGFNKSEIWLECTISLPDRLLHVCKRPGEMTFTLTSKSRRQQPSIEAAKHSPDGSKVDLTVRIPSTGSPELVFWACHEGSSVVQYLRILSSHLGTAAGAESLECSRSEVSGAQVASSPMQCIFMLATICDAHACCT